jgi:hypothetical protein
MSASMLRCLPGIVILMTACSPAGWTPPDEETRSQSFVECLRGQLEVCEVDEIPLESCTPFDWDTVFIANQRILSWAADRWTDTNEDVAKAIRGRPSSRMMGLADCAFFFFERDFLVDVFKIGYSDIDASRLVGARLSRREAVFSNRLHRGECGQPVVDPHFQASQELREDLLVWHLSQRIMSNTRMESYCVPDAIALLIPRVMESVGSTKPDPPARRLFPFSECEHPDSTFGAVTVAATGEEATELYFSGNPVFYSATKARIDYGSHTGSLASSSASSIVTRTENGWESQVVWVWSVS